MSTGERRERGGLRTGDQQPDHHTVPRPRPWLRITAPSWLARILIAAGAQSAPTNPEDAKENER